MPSRARWCAGMAVISRPWKKIRPPSLRSVPEMQLMSVVLPEPLGPIRPKRSPVWISRLTPLRAWNPPKPLTTRSTRRRGSAISESGSPPSGARPPAHPLEEPEDPLGRQDHEAHQDYPHDQEVQLGGDRHRGHLLGGAQEDRADDGADPRRRPSD